MAIEQVVKQRSSAGIGKDGVRWYEEKWLVESTLINDAPATILAAGALSGYGWYSAHPTDTLARLKEKSCEQTADLNVWEVTLKWDTEFDEFDRSIAPENRTWHYDYGGTAVEWPLVYDRTEDAAGRPRPKLVCASNGIQYDPAPQIPTGHGTITITLFRTSANPSKIATYFQAVNSDEFEGYPAGTLKCTDYKQTPQNEAEWGDFYQYQITLEHKPDGWNPLKLLDAGTMQRVNGLLLSCREQRTGQAVTSPVPLDGNGAQLIFPTEPGAALPTFSYRNFQAYRARPFEYIVAGTPPATLVPPVIVNSSNSGGVDEVTIPLPTGTAEGDLVVGWIRAEGTAGGIIGAPDDENWTLLEVGTYGDDDEGSYWLGCRRHAAGASYTWDEGTAVASTFMEGCLISVSGAATPNANNASSARTGNDDTPVGNSVYSHTASGLLLWFAANLVDVSTYTAPEGMTDLPDATSGTGTAAYESGVETGDSGGRTGEIDPEREWACAMLVLAPG